MSKTKRLFLRLAKRRVRIVKCNPGYQVRVTGGTAYWVAGSLAEAKKIQSQEVRDILSAIRSACAVLSSVGFEITLRVKKV